MSTGVKEMKTSLLMTIEAANCTSSSSRRERKGASDGKWVECRLKSFIGAAKESEGVRGSHVISQCCFGCIATGLSISPSVGGGGAVACGQESSVLVIEAK